MLKRFKAWFELLKRRGKCAVCTPFCKYVCECAKDLEDEYEWNL